MEDLKTTYNRIAEDWAREHHNYFEQWWIPITKQFASLFQKGNIILDVGCGPGIFSRALEALGLHVIGVDFSERMIGIARRNSPRGNFFIMDARSIGIMNVHFDGIFANALLLHFSKKEIREMLYILRENLRPGGYAYFGVKERKPGQAEEEVKHEEDYGYAYERPFSYFSLDELRGLLEELRFVIVYRKFLTTGNTRWIQIIARKEAC